MTGEMSSCGFHQPDAVIRGTVPGSKSPCIRWNGGVCARVCTQEARGPIHYKDAVLPL